MNTEIYIKKCTEYIIRMVNLVQAQNSLNYYDINITSESFFRSLLNIVYDWNLKNANIENKNATAIDLYDDDNRISIQVTSDDSAQKIRKTIQKFIDNKLFDKYDKLLFFVISHDKKYRSDFDTCGKFIFDKFTDIITCNKLLKIISDLKPEKLKEVADFLEFEFNTVFDINFVWNLNSAEEYIKNCTGDIIDLDYFEIDDNNFIKQFENSINDKRNVFVKGFSKEETFYCILYQLRKMQLHVPLYIIRDKNTWDEARKNSRNCILIPYFQSSEIPAIAENINIFVYGVDEVANDKKCIILRRRKMRTLHQKLENKGNGIGKIIRKTNGLFSFIKNELFVGKPQIPDWAREYSKEVILALLIGKWTACEGDKQIIESFFNITYPDFLLNIKNLSNSDSPFIIELAEFSGSIFTLADAELAWSYMKDKLTIEIKKPFMSSVEKIILDKDPLFDEPIENHFLASIRAKKPVYSYALKHGIMRSLIFIAINGDQVEVDRCIETMLSKVNSLNDWAYISQFAQEICEASPEIFLRKVENSLDSEPFLQLFTYASSDWFTARYYYTNILWAIECLFTKREYVFRAVAILMELAERIEKCPISNSPYEMLSDFFCPWFNITSVTPKEKVILAENGVKKYPRMWELIYDKIEENNTIIMSARCTFDYRIVDDLYEVNSEEVYEQNNAFVSILMKNIHNSPDKWIKVIRILNKTSDDLFNKLINQLSKDLQNMNDDKDKECIKTELRMQIHKHRCYAGAVWAMPEKRILLIEDLCKKITFSNYIYEYLYLMLPVHKIPLYNPYSSKQGWRSNEKKIDFVYKEAFENIKHLNLDICDLITLKKDNEYTRFGSFLAKYYSCNRFDKELFTRIVKIPNSDIIIRDYVQTLFNNDWGIFEDALRIIKEHNNSDDLYISVLKIPMIDKKMIDFIVSQPKNIQEKYFRDNHYAFAEDPVCISILIGKYIEFGAYNNFLNAINEFKSRMSSDLLISYLEALPGIINKNPIDKIDSYPFEEIVKYVHELIKNDKEKYISFAKIEIQFYKILGWHSMMCTQYLFKTNAAFYTELLYKLKSKSDDSNKDFDFLYGLYHDAFFCPGDIEGDINEHILKKWISDFNELLNEYNLNEIFKDQLGRLFAHSPMGKDGYYPHESIREIIELNYDEDLKNGYYASEVNKRGVYWCDAGEGEKSLAAYYKKNANMIRIKYPKTALIYDSISNRYFEDSKHERTRAENGMY